MSPRGFEHIDRALDIDALEKFRLIQAGPDAGAGREMNDLIERDLGEQVFQGLHVGQIFGDEGERFAERRDFLEIFFFDRRAVERIQVIQGPDGVAIAQQPFANVRADEARAAGDQNIHARTLTTEGQAVECGQTKMTKRLKSFLPLLRGTIVFFH